MRRLYWAKVRPDAVIPQKRLEDAGYDLYPCFEEDWMEVAPLETKMIPMGVASAFDPDCVIFLKERGSTGTKGIAQRSGVIDSGYRGEYLCPVTNLNEKPLRIIKKEAVSKVEDLDAYLFYPYEKALCQAVLLPIVQAESAEISLDELTAIPSLRQAGRLGSSGK